MGKASLWTFVLPIGLLALLPLLLRRQAGELRRTPLVLAVLTSGIAGMVFDTTLILAFQCLYGYVYEMIGLLVACFMLGLAAGSAATPRLLGRSRGLSLLVGVEALVLTYSLSVPALLVGLQSLSGQAWMVLPAQLAIFALNFLCGVLVGAEFPLANHLYLEGSDRVGQVAGLLYASDLIGAWVGALAASIWLIPVLGVPKTCLVVAAGKVTSLLLVVARRR